MSNCSIIAEANQYSQFLVRCVTMCNPSSCTSYFVGVLPLKFSVSAFFSLFWWKEEKNVLAGVHLAPPCPAFVLYIDASKTIWGPKWTTHGLWSLVSHPVSGTYQSSWDAGSALSPDSPLSLSHNTVMIACNNMTVIAYINNQWGTHCDGWFLVSEFLSCTELHLSQSSSVSTSVTYIFESLVSAELKFLMWKMFFLLCLASGWHCGEVHILSMDPSG